MGSRWVYPSHDEDGTPLYTPRNGTGHHRTERAQEALQMAKYTVDSATEAIYW